MRRAHLAPDGTLYGIGEATGAVEIDDVAWGPPGTRYVLDPQSPRRAIPAPPPVPTYAELRAREYPPTDALVVALWERFIEGRPEASEALEAQRQAIKAKHPKPKE